jgi:hypothetical protein
MEVLSIFLVLHKNDIWVCMLAIFVEEIILFGFEVKSE